MSFDFPVGSRSQQQGESILPDKRPLGSHGVARRKSRAEPVMRGVALALALTLVGACSSARAPSSAALHRWAEELDILEAVFRYQFDHNASGSNPDCIFLSLSEGKEGDAPKDPPPALLARFKGHTPPVEPESAADLDSMPGVHRRGEQSDHGILFRLTTIRWIDPDTVEVDGGYFQNGLSASGNTYRVEREQRAWVVVSDTMHWIS
jgi:hypothetical protein